VSDSPLRKSPKSRTASVASSTASQDEDIISADLTAQPNADAGCAEPLHVAPEMTLAEAFFGTAAEAGASSEDGPASAAVTPTEADPATDGGEGGDSFGWFLDLDTPTDASEEHITDAYSAEGNSNSSTSSLAFQAPVSVANHDAEVEWAKAADTVDDVLGDLPF